MSELDDIQRKLKKRMGKPGFRLNVAALQTTVAVHTHEGPFRDPDTGQFVARDYALTNPDKVEIV